MVAGRKINKLSLTQKRNINGFIKRRRNYLASFYIYTNNENDSTHYYSLLGQHLVKFFVEYFSYVDNLLILYSKINNLILPSSIIIRPF